MGVLAGDRMITRKHMNMMAEKVRSIEDAETRNFVMGVFMTVCKESNPKFDASRFLDACGVFE